MTKSEKLKENESIKITISIDNMMQNILNKDTFNFEDIYEEDLKSLLLYASNSKLFEYTYNEKDMFYYDIEYPQETFQRLEDLEEKLLSSFTTNKFILRTFQ